MSDVFEMLSDFYHICKIGFASCYLKERFNFDHCNHFIYEKSVITSCSKMLENGKERLICTKDKPKLRTKVTKEVQAFAKF